MFLFFYKVSIAVEVKPSISVYSWRKPLLSGHVCPSDLIRVHPEAMTGVLIVYVVFLH